MHGLTMSLELFFFFFLFTHFKDTKHCSVDPVHCSWNPQILYLKKNFKMDLTTLFTHLKIILLQCFQQNKRYPNGS